MIDLLPDLPDVHIALLGFSDLGLALLFLNKDDHLLGLSLPLESRL